MKFRLEQSFIDKRKRWPLINLAIFALFLLGFGVFSLIDKPESGVLIFIVALAITIAFGYRDYKLYKYWSTYGGDIEIELTNTSFIERSANGVSEIELSSIERINIQQRKGSINSILMKTKAGGEGKLIGFENMDLLCKELEQILGKGKIKVSKWFHR